MHEAGKGDARRPMSISDQQYAQRWDLIFGKDEHEDGKTGGGENQERMGLEGKAQRDGKRQEPREISECNQGQDIERSPACAPANLQG